MGDWPVEANASLDEGVPTTSPRDVEEVEMDPPSGVVTTPEPLLKSTGARPCKKLLPDQVLVTTYVPPLERVHSLTVREVPDLEDVLKVIYRWNPFNQEESSITRMHDLYPTYYWVPVAARLEHYTIHFPTHMDKDAF